MHLDVTVALAGLLVGFVVGLTGMGGGALMTPVLVLLFNIQPLAAVSSDLVAAVVMKPVGGAVHARRGTVNRKLVGWLCAGSVPSAFCGVLLLRALGDGSSVQHTIKVVLGVTLLVAAAAMVAKAVLGRRAEAGASAGGAAAIQVRPVPTLVIGVVGGLVVGLTSVGSGSLMIVALMLLYPTLRPSDLVGTDLVQAVPLVGSAALGHLIFGDVQFGLTTSLLIGALPGVFAGAHASSRAPGAVIRHALVIVLTLSALKLLDVATTTLGFALAAMLAVSAGLAVRHFRRHAADRATGPAATPAQPDNRPRALSASSGHQPA